MTAVSAFADGPGDARAIGWHPGSDPRYRRVYVATHRDTGGVLGAYRPTPGWTRLSLSGEIRVGGDPVGIAIDGATHRVYVASVATKTISVILQGPG